MPSDQARQALLDIRDNILLAQAFAAGLELETFLADQKTQYSVIRALEIISEASRKLPDSIKAGNAQLPWAQIAAAGNIYRHEYQNVTADFVWNTLTNSLPELLIVVQAELEKI